jgi:predicted secreted hydrolase
MPSTRPTIVAITLFTLILLSTIIPPAAAENAYTPQDDTLQDNAYNTTNRFALQWWYLDAAFTTNTSTHIGVVTIGAHRTIGFYLLQLQYYINGTLAHQDRRIIPLKRVTAATETLLLTLQGKTFLREYLTDEHDRALEVNLTINNMTTNLTFTGTMKGWKGSTNLGMWGCPLPKATVQGTITINTTTIPVQGIGYQEHGWNIRKLHRSWFWGKIVSEHLNLIFSQNMKNHTEEDVFVAVLNYGKENYTSIGRANITLLPSEYTWTHGHHIPMSYALKMDQDGIHINVTIKAVTVHFSTILIMNYWRFHMKVTGTMTCGNLTDSIDNYQIMEAFHFP